MALVPNPASPLVSKLRGVHLFGFDAAPCSQRVSFALAEKGLVRAKSVAWQSDKAADLIAPEGGYAFRQVSLIRQQHLSPEYAQIQPNMVLPALVHDGRLYVESMDIVAYLDEAWPDNPLVPRDPGAVRLTEELVDLGKKLHVSIRYVSFHWGLGKLGRVGAKQEATIRELESEKSPEKLLNFYSRFNRDQIAEDVYVGHLRDLEQAWADQEARFQSDGRPFLTGDTFSKADIVWAIKTLRIFECGYPFEENFPALFAWFNRVRQRPGFQQGVMASHRTLSTIFRIKSKVENALGMGLRGVSRSAA